MAPVDRIDHDGIERMHCSNLQHKRKKKKEDIANPQPQNSSRTSYKTSIVSWSKSQHTTQWASQAKKSYPKKCTPPYKKGPPLPPSKANPTKKKKNQQISLHLPPKRPRRRLPSAPPPLRASRTSRVRRKRPQPGHLHARVRRARPPREPAHARQAERLCFFPRHPRRANVFRHAGAARGRGKGAGGYGGQSGDCDWGCGGGWAEWQWYQ